MKSEDETESFRRLLHNGGGNEKPEPRRERQVPWKLIAVVLVAVVVVAVVIVLKPWEGNPDEEEQPDNQAEENVWFCMETSFTYRSSADNLPIENVAIRFPCPNVENNAIRTYSTWSLYYQENNNTLALQATGQQVYGFRGARTSNLEIYLSGVEPTIDGPKLYYNLDRLYPQEMFWIITFAYAPEKDASKVTLKVYGDNQGRSSAYYAHWPVTENFINLSFWAQLSKKIDNAYEPIEIFSRMYDNGDPAWYWLNP